MSTACHQLGRRLPMPAAWPARSRPAAPRWAIVSAGRAPVLLTGGCLDAGGPPPASSRPVTTTISPLARLSWLLMETRDGSVLGLAERLTSSIQTCWPFIIAFALRRAGPRPAAHAQRERPAPGARSSPGYPAGRPSPQKVPAIPGRIVVRRVHDAGRSGH